jgi:hypothetical protein
METLLLVLRLDLRFWRGGMACREIVSGSRSATILGGNGEEVVNGGVWDEESPLKILNKY